MTKKKHYLCRAGRAGGSDLAARIPELVHMAGKTVSLFGLGALGAPLALELAKAGVGELRILDCDFVEPATTVRWPFGLASAGHLKARYISDFIRQNYPLTKVTPENHSIGSAMSSEGNKDELIIGKMTEGSSLIIDATAEVGIQTYLSITAEELGIPFISVDATPGAWGGSICRIDPAKTKGCWNCFRTCLYGDSPPSIPLPPADPNGEVQPAGCAEPTFTGGSFDLGTISLQTARIAIATLSSGEEGSYPYCDHDVIIVSLRSQVDAFTLPNFEGYHLEKHSDCHRCKE